MRTHRPDSKLRYTRSNGYVEVVVGIGHHLANSQGRALEHRVVAETKIGRRLRPREVVHHVNRVKDDNRPENLMVFASSAAHHAHHRAADRVALVAASRALPPLSTTACPQKHMSRWLACCDDMEALAKSLGVTTGTLCIWARDGRPRSMHMAERLERMTGICATGWFSDEERFRHGTFLLITSEEDGDYDILIDRMIAWWSARPAEELYDTIVQKPYGHVLNMALEMLDRDVDALPYDIVSKVLSNRPRCEDVLSSYTRRYKDRASYPHMEAWSPS